jgi:hypothetical protein
MKRHRNAAALLVSAAALTTLAQAPSSVAVPAASGFAGRVGLASSTVYVPAATAYGYLQQARDGGVTWIREDFAWSVIEPSPGRFRWRRTDALMRNAAKLGINVLAVAAYAPPWASGHPESDYYPPLDPTAYAAFVTAVAKRYGRNGVFWKQHRLLAPRPLSAIEIWNEPWHAYFWRPTPDPKAYARLVRVAAGAVKSVHPEISILASGDIFEMLDTRPGESPDWLSPLLAADKDLWRQRLVDAWSVHLYCQNRSPLDSTTPQRWRFDRVLLTRALASKVGATKPIWITEFGWNTDPGDAESVTEAMQAQFERDSLVRVANQWSFVQRSFVFQWTKPSGNDGYNLLRPDGSTRPAWEAIRTLIATGR